jgi:hypothetical protein
LNNHARIITPKALLFHELGISNDRRVRHFRTMVLLDVDRITSRRRYILKICVMPIDLQLLYAVFGRFSCFIEFERESDFIYLLMPNCQFYLIIRIVNT